MGKPLISTRLLSKKSLFLLLVVGILSLVFTQTVVLSNVGNDFIFNYVKTASLPFSLESTQSIGDGLVINTTNCKIPKFPAWSSEVRKLLPLRCSSYYLGDPKCGEKHAWSYLNNSHIHINLTAIVESGYTWNSTRCCYSVIQRVFLDKQDLGADRTVRYSDKCYPVSQTRQLIDADFIRFQCVSDSMPFLGNVVFKEFFANVKPDAIAQAKMEKWASISNRSSKNGRPPSVLMLGVDTMSRLNSIRNFEKARAMLKSIGAFELKGYTKVGETTLPNTVAFLSGNTQGQLEKVCFWNRTEPFDNCPFIWKHFSKMDYLTSTMEDFTPSWNYELAGFVNKPVDFYFRPFIVALMKDFLGTEPKPDTDVLRCLCSKQLEQVFLEYIENMLEVARPSGTPVFVHLWLASLGHECGITPKYTDWIFAKHILRISKLYKNTVIIFMGDHGEKHGAFRESMQGWYEDKLPMFWIYLPDGLKERFPDWVKALKENSERLTSHFDLYKTLVHILQTFDEENILKDELYDNQKEKAGQSLFTEIQENRTCNDAGVVEAYCPCSAPREADVKSEQVKNAVSAAISYIIKSIPGDLCETPVLKKIVKAQVIRTTKPWNYDVYTVQFYTDPGNFLFEASVSDKDGKFELTTYVFRVNSIRRNTECVKTKTYLKRYCYCK